MTPTVRETSPMSADEPGLDAGPTRREGLDRRALLRRTAVAGAVAWVAPQILSVDAASAATCLASAVNWGENQSTIDTINDFPAAYPFTLPVNGSTTVDVDFVPIAPLTTTVGFIVPVFPLDAAPTTSFIELATSDADPAPAPGTIAELSLTFSTPLRYLSFSLLDVDRGQGFWQDEVELLPTLGGSSITPAQATFTLHSGTITHTAIAGGDRFVATTDPSGTGAGAPNNSDIGKIDVEYSFAQLLDKLVIRYLAGPDESSPLRAQQIGVTNFTACAY